MKKANRRFGLLISATIVSGAILFLSVSALFLQYRNDGTGGVYSGTIQVESCRPVGGLLPGQMCTGSYFRGGGGDCWLDSRSVYTLKSPTRGDNVHTYNPISTCGHGVWVPNTLIDFDIAKSIATVGAVIGAVGLIISTIFLITSQKRR